MKAVIYARVSTVDRQDYTRQLTQLQDVCKKHGYKTQDIEVFAESVSGYNKTERHQLDTMLRKVEESPKNYTIYVSEISRLGRNPITTRQIIDRLTEIGVPVYIQSLNQFTLENGKRNMIMNIILQVLLEYANLESLTTKERSKQGLRQSALNGKAGGSLNLPYGYRKDDKGMLVIDKEESKVIKEIYELYATGTNGIKVISQLLNEQGTQTRLNKAFANRSIKFKSAEKDASRVKWSDKTIHDILRNTIYIGKRKWKGEIIEAPQLAIISPKLFEKCNEIMVGKTHRNYLNKHIFGFKDLMTCGCCGRNYFGRYKAHKVNIDKYGKKKDAFENNYICSSRLAKGGACKNAGVNISLIESLLYWHLSNPETILAFVNSADKMKEDITASIKQLEQSLRLEMNTLTSKGKEKERLLDIYLSGGIPKTTFNQRQEIVDKALELINNRVDNFDRALKAKNKALAELASTKMNKKKLESFRNDRTQLQAFFKQSIKKIVITKLDNDNVLAAVDFNYRFSSKANQHQFLLDVSGLRKKPIVYRAKGAFLKDGKPSIKSFDNTPWLYLNDVLTME